MYSSFLLKSLSASRTCRHHSNPSAARIPLILQHPRKLFPSIRQSSRWVFADRLLDFGVTGLVVRYVSDILDNEDCKGGKC